MVIAYCFLHAIIILLAFLPFLYTTYLGLFPNHIPNPEDKTAIMSITQAVLDNKADLGIIFDTDVDRYNIASLWGSADV